MSFQPFVVQCLTCGSQLRVTDPAIVGTIASCPKCNSMVQIDRPGPQVAVGGSNIDSQAITEEAISASDGASLGSAEAVASGFVGDEGNDTGSVEPISASPMPPPWQSDRTQRSRQIALVIALSLVSLLVAVAGFWWFVQSSRGRQSSAQNSESAGSESAASGSAASESAASGAAGESAAGGASSDPPVTNQAENSLGEAAEGPTDAATNGMTDNSIDRATETNNSEGQALGKDEVPTPQPTPVELDQRDSVTDLLPRSPLDPLPSNVPAPPAPQAPTAPLDQESTASGLQELPPELAKYTKFLLEEGSAEKPTLQAPPTMDEVTIEAAADELDDPTIIVRPKEINLKADLAIRMALDTKGYPLPDLVLLISQITGVPIQIDWVSFDLMGIDLDAPVTAPTGWQTARAILNTAAAGIDAELREEETLVMITPTDEAFDKHLALLTDLNDFGDAKSSAKEVLIDFLRGEGEDAGSEIPFGLSRDDRQISAIAVEALRRMRGIEPNVADDRMHRWAWPSNDPSGEWMPLTGGEAGPQLDAPIAMADFLRRTAKRNNATTLVNWYDFSRRGVAPERLLLPHTEADAGKTLDRVLRPLGLQARQVDAGHWWLGRESTYDRLPALVWTPPLGERRTLRQGVVQRDGRGISRCLSRDGRSAK